MKHIFKNIITSKKNGYKRQFVQGGRNIWTPISNILGQVFSSAAAKTAQETVKQTAKKAVQDIGKAAIVQAGEKGVKAAKDKLAKILASKPAEKAKLSPNETIIQENPSKGSGPSMGNILTSGLGIKKKLNSLKYN